MYQKDVVLYTRSRSLRCWRARRLLQHRGYQFEVVDTTNSPEALDRLLKVAHRMTALPYVFVDHRPVGDFGIIKALDRSGTLERLVRHEI